MTDGAPYVPGGSLGTNLVEPKFNNLQRLISNSIFGRGNGSQKPGRSDMQLLKALYYGKTDSFFGMICALIRISQRPWGLYMWVDWSRTCFRGVHGIDEDDSRTLVESVFMTKEKIKDMKGVTVDDGVAGWDYRKIQTRLRAAKGGTQLPGTGTHAGSSGV